jgi:hypothetical protein
MEKQLTEIIRRDVDTQNLLKVSIETINARLKQLENQVQAQAQERVIALGAYVVVIGANGFERLYVYIYMTG